MVQSFGGEFVIIKGTTHLFDEFHCLCFVLLTQDRKEFIIDGTGSLEVSADSVPYAAVGGIHYVGVACGIADALRMVVRIVSALGIVDVISPMQESGCVVLIAHPHGQKACNKGDVNDAVR